jgi:RNA polymerase sigma-70 factor (ECF subfamily)
VRTETAPEVSSLISADALVELYDSHARQLHLYLARRVGTQVADDLVGEAFLVVWEQRASFDPSRASVKAWLYGIATNLLRRHVRSEVRRLEAWARDHGRRSSVEDIGERTVATVDARVLAGELAATIAGLRPEDRDVLLLVAWAHLTPLEIAEVLGIAVVTVRSRLHRARAKVRGQMIEPGQQPGTSLEENGDA